jgi:nitrous oxidase accessory protein NosD
MLNERIIKSVSDFGASPEKENNANELRSSIDWCRGKKGITLKFPPGIYHFQDEKAVEFRDKIMTGIFGNMPEKKMFFPYAPYIKGLDFSDCEDLIVDADGVLILYDGWLEPISLEKCKNITINGLSIDYRRKPFSEGKYVKKGMGYFEVEIFSQFPVEKGVPCPRVEFWNNDENQLIKAVAYCPKSKLIGPQKVRLIGLAPDLIGNITALIIHSFHFRPAILIHEAENITLNKVSIHAQPGMGIVGHRSHNLTFNQVNILPTEGVHMSTNTDASHFTSCTGLITFDGCHFEGQGDDSTNIHNYYYTITKIHNQTVDTTTLTIRVDAPTGTHAQVLDYPDVGDMLELVEKNTLNPINTFQVLEVQNYPDKWISLIKIKGKLPMNYKSYLFADVTRLPKTIIKNCHFGNHLARGMLIKTRNVLIENNLIEKSIGTGIHVGAEAGWGEGVTSADITIRNNKIIDCGGNAGTINGTSGIAFNIDTKNPTAIGAHKRITIENNLIVGSPKLKGISISNAENVVIRQNQFQQCNPNIFIQYSKNIEIVQNVNTSIEIGAEVNDLKQKNEI